MSRIKRRILVVDDNPAIHADFRKILCADKHEVSALEANLFGDAQTAESGPSFELEYASQGREALQLVSAACSEGRPYVMAFIDVRMPPGWDGIETTARIWEVDPRLQVVICTAHSDYSWEQMATQLKHADQFVILRKPFDVVEVIQLANAFTEKWRLLQEVAERTKTLVESEKRYHFLAETMPGMVWTATPEGKIDYANKQLDEYSGKLFAQMKDDGWQQIVHPEDLPRCLDQWTGSIQSGRPYQVEYRLRRACDGSYRWHLGRAVPMRNEKAEIVRWVGTSVDIEDQKGAEETLRQAHAELETRVRERTTELASAKARLQTVLDSATYIAIIATDPSGLITVFNTGAERMLGYTAAEIVGRQTPAIFHLESEAISRGKELTQQCGRPITGFDVFVELARHGKHEEHDWTYVRKDGSHLTVTLVVTALHDEQGKLSGFLRVARDITERKRSEEQLRLQTSALESTHNGIVITDRRGHILWVNPAFTRLTGYSRDEVIGKTPALLRSSSQDRSFYESMWKTILGGKMWQGELINRRKDGSEYHEEMTITPVLDQNGEIRNFVAIMQDISQRKEFEQQLALERDMLQGLMDNLPDFIYFKDTRSRFLRINRAHARFLGLVNPGEAVGKTDVDFIPTHFSRQTLVDEARMMTTGEPVLDKLEDLRTEAGELWVSATKVPTRDKHGHITGLVGVSRNITERKRVEEELRSQKESFRVLTDNAPDAIARFDRDRRYVYGNRVLENRIGMPISGFLGKTNEELGLPAQGEWNDAIRRVFESGQTVTFEFQSESPAGPSFQEARLVPEHSTYGSVLYVLAVVRDVTERKQAEKEQHLMEVQLRQAQKLESIGQLAAGIAHEINTPTQYVGDNTRFLKDSFQSITGVLRAYEELLQAAKNNAVTPELLVRVEELLTTADLAYLFEQIPAAIKETLEGIERVSKIVRAMKEFSHPGGKEKASADVNKAIETTVTVARNEWKYVAEMELELAPDLPAVPCFLGEFNQSILNLVVNAAHAIGDAVKPHPGAKGKITIRTRRDGDHVEVRVSDTGTGIPEAARPRIFEPFFTTKDVGKGTGQGLTIVYTSIVKKHGGTVKFETETGIGTTFILSLPLGPPQPQQEGKTK